MCRNRPAQEGVEREGRLNGLDRFTSVIDDRGKCQVIELRELALRVGKPENHAMAQFRPDVFRARGVHHRLIQKGEEFLKMVAGVGGFLSRSQRGELRGHGFHGSHPNSCVR